jgi:hypothetical protein
MVSLLFTLTDVFLGSLYGEPGFVLRGLRVLGRAPERSRVRAPGVLA